MRVIALVFILSVGVFGCVYDPPVQKVSRSFSVRVKNDTGAVAGLKLKVTRFKTEEFENLTAEQRRSADPKDFEEIISESSTDDSGMAHFNLNRVGHFTLYPDSPAIQLGWIELDVSKEPGSPIIELQWPTVQIMRTAQLRGKLSQGLFTSHREPLVSAQLRLHTITDYREITGTTTTSDGAFDFGTIASGLYFLQILPTSEKTHDFYKPEGNIAVYVTADAPRDNLAISTANTSCGLMYDFDENKPRYKPESCFKGGKPVTCEY